LKFAIAILAAFALLLAGCTSAPPATGNPSSPPAAVPPTAGNAITPPSTDNTQITLAQLATHNTEADCWVGYDGQVYDITAFIPNHKNYQELIVPLCGSSDQFKAMFEGKHGMSKVSLLESMPLKGTLGQ
jgi:cytochrome b involved in lipid metabolism